jgi:hypothetical protein
VSDDAAAARAGLKLDTTVSHSARIWNYWLGGKDNFAVDREAGDRVAAMLPSIVAQARADRAFLGRAIRYLAGEAGIRQFLDIGTGLPTAENTHEVAQRVAPRSADRVRRQRSAGAVARPRAARQQPGGRLRPGSFLALNHSTSAVHGAAMEEAVAHWNQVGTPSMTLRTPQQIARFFDGMDLLEPGVVSCSRWRPALAPVGGQPAEVDEFCGVARKT